MRTRSPERPFARPSRRRQGTETSIAGRTSATRSSIPGRKALERVARARPSAGSLWDRIGLNGRLAVYLAAIVLVMIPPTSVILAAQGPFSDAAHAFWLLSVLGLIALSALAVSLVNLWVTWIVPPKTLPRLDFSRGIPLEHRTLVVVPTLLSDAAGIQEMLEALEIRYFGNRDANLFFALLTDFRDAPQPVHARRPRASRAGPVRHRGAERKARREPPVGLLPVPPPTKVEPARAALHGMGAEARKARAAERVPEGRRGGRVLRDRRRFVGPSHDQVRHHPGYRHQASTRHGAEAGRQPRAPSQPPRLRRGARARRRRLRDPAAAGCDQPGERGALPVRTAVRRRGRARPLHARGVGRLSGSLRRRLVRRQGDLRRRRVSRGGGRPVSREPDPEPRPPGERLRSCRARDRRRAHRRPSVHGRRRGEPPPPVDPRRLADRRLALPAGPRAPRDVAGESAERCLRSGRSPTT